MQPARDLSITWRPISLLFKNEPSEDSEYYEASAFTHKLLRVMESVKASARTPDAGNDDVFKLYWEMGSRIHHDRNRDFTAADVLDAVSLDPAHAAAFHDDSWDEAIRTGMEDGLSLVGTDVGTPIIATRRSDGERAGYFGPVINRVPDLEQGLAMWDGLMAMMDVDSFFELKRTRSGDLDFGDRPTVHLGSDPKWTWVR